MEFNLKASEIVSELDKYIVGQDDAKRLVAIALRNRWRRMHVTDDIRDDIIPSNIIMIGPTIFASLLAISVLPTPVGPIIIILEGMISSRISS
ncbi:MAG: hypothetical protein SVK54_01975, partial [candidate division WOR-3 bacterium]|nr:hypothetical protein [candidate division WOR-3 bacterium]